MKQLSLTQSLSGFERKPKVTRKQRFLQEMQAIIPWSALEQLLLPCMPKPGAKGGRPAFAALTMLRIHFLQQWFGLSDPAMEEALHDLPLYRDFAGLDIGVDAMPDESTILRFRHLLEEHQLAPRILELVNHLLQEQGLLLQKGTTVDATLIAAPTSTKNSTGKRDAQMHSSKKGNQWHFGMKAHIGTDSESGLVHTVIGTAGNVHDVTQANDLLHGKEHVVLGDAGYTGAHKREGAPEDVQWFVALKRSVRKKLDTQCTIGLARLNLEKTKASLRAKVEHAFRVLKCQFGYRKVRYKGLKKNTAQLHTLFALVNLWMVRKKLMGNMG